MSQCKTFIQASNRLFKFCLKPIKESIHLLKFIYRYARRFSKKSYETNFPHNDILSTILEEFLTFQLVCLKELSFIWRSDSRQN